MKWFFATLVVLLLLSCKAQQSTSLAAKTKAQTDVYNDITLSVQDSLLRSYERDIVRLINEHSSIKIIKYDTSKPVDPITNRPPVSEETTINTETELIENDSAKDVTQSASGLDIKDNSRINADVKTSVAGKSKTGLSDIQKWLIYIGVFAIIAVVLAIIIKVKKWI
jgi:hypothetical protein